MICSNCQRDLPDESFDFRKNRNKRVSKCVECRRQSQRTRYERYKRERYFKYKATRARSRATSLGVPFDLDAEYLAAIWTDACPVTGIAFVRDADRSDEAAAELDRFVPERGYVKGNVAFLSRKMNRIKNNVNIEELRSLLSWMEAAHHA